MPLAPYSLSELDEETKKKKGHRCREVSRKRQKRRGEVGEEKEIRMWGAKYEETGEEGGGAGTRGRAGRVCRNHRIFSLQMRKVRPRKRETAGRGTWYLDPQARNFGKGDGDQKGNGEWGGGISKGERWSTNLGLGTEVSTYFTDPKTVVASGLVESLCGPSSCGLLSGCNLLCLFLVFLLPAMLL